MILWQLNIKYKGNSVVTCIIACTSLSSDKRVGRKEKICPRGKKKEQHWSVICFLCDFISLSHCCGGILALPYYSVQFHEDCGQHSSLKIPPQHFNLAEVCASPWFFDFFFSLPFVDLHFEFWILTFKMLTETCTVWYEALQFFLEFLLGVLGRLNVFHLWL